MSPDARAGSRGFSVVELLIVVGIIMVLTAVLAPNIGQYIRNYKIRGEASTIATNLQKARNKAIMKNVNLGVSVVVENPTTYWVHLEDDQLDNVDTTRDVTRQNLDTTTPDPIQSTRFRLGNNIRFATTAAECPTAPGPGGFVPAWTRLRFSRLGAWCIPGSGCPPFTVNGPTLAAIQTTATGGLLCVNEPNTGLSRWISISAGGRIAAQQ
jgi:Tfp pilus assembly protein FimT